MILNVSRLCCHFAFERSQIEVYRLIWFYITLKMRVTKKPNGFQLYSLQSANQPLFADFRTRFNKPSIKRFQKTIALNPPKLARHC